MLWHKITLRMNDSQTWWQQHEAGNKTMDLTPEGVRSFVSFSRDVAHPWTSH